ncbi:helix-hairpin-helix domain-containing protein [Lactococcus taiwanensis]|uniref:helix-hairpin-helix domain-containing protein n=1 Tax=Lactococcus taiwanensis TaxID=1151742 RepID=UPI001963B4DA|nr:helix-hairpin-helix domain-containing protein [Lactococcus taiwanensis]QRZ11123.1 helix-hairpin-helix domain-containing protein [Lactococcus taiwanensis]
MEKIVEIIKENWKMMVLILVGVITGGIGYVLTQPKTPDQPAAVTQLENQPASSDTDQSVSKSENSISTSQIVVDLKGAVKYPKVYRIAADERVDDLIQLAGGFTADADQRRVNLAAKLKDEEVVYVSKKGENSPEGVANTSDATDQPLTTSSAAKVNINTADLASLETLSGIGEKKAQDIIDYRTKNGNFQKLEDLGNVSGFGVKTLEKLKDSICID